MKRPVVLAVLDGWGIAPDGQGNAIALARTPNFTRLWQTYPHGQLQASGESVGLPRSEVGNTETGHLNLGAGRIVYQDLPRINMAIADGSIYRNKAILGAINHARTNHSKLHIMGLIGAGGVHANNDHLYALLFLCKEQNFHNIYVHLFTDGRDSPPNVAIEYVRKVQEELKLIGFGFIASIMGRYFAMDRDSRWERTGKAYMALTSGSCPCGTSAEEIIKKFYERGITDEFIEPTIIVNTQNQPLGTISDNDACIFYNFRIDRPRQLTKAFVLNDLEAEMRRGKKKERFGIKQALSVFNKSPDTFKRPRKLANLFFVTMTEYEKNLPVEIAFPPSRVNFPIGRVIANHGLTQLRLTESEKERFVVFYFNGQREAPFIGEDRIIIPSLKVPTYDLAPQMRAREITETLIKKLQENIYDFIVVNFPNADMVGHSGVISAAILGCEVIDECLAQIEHALAPYDGALLITADHGNAEEMINAKTGGVYTEHSNFPVPFIVIAKEFEGKPRELRSGILADVAPTILSLLDIPAPIEMTGYNLLL